VPLLWAAASDPWTVPDHSDGVLWKGEELIEGVPEALARLRSLGKQLVFVVRARICVRKLASGADTPPHTPPPAARRPAPPAARPLHPPHRQTTAAAAAPAWRRSSRS
jgi:hypothetical protein